MHIVFFIKMHLLKVISLFALIFFVHGNVTGDHEKIGSKNILVYFGFGSYSMRISMWPLLEALAEKGHKVTFLSPHEKENIQSTNSKVTTYVPKKLKESGAGEEAVGIDLFEKRKEFGGVSLFWYEFPSAGLEACEQLVTDPLLHEWMRISKFDLVIIDNLLNECGYGLAHYFKAKTILFSTFAVAPWFGDILGMADETSWISDMIYYYPAHQPSFLSRATSALDSLVWKLIREYYYLPKMDRIIRDGLGPEMTKGMPTLSELEKQTSLALVTTHYAQEYPRSLPPNVIPVGGLAIVEKRKKLPKDMEDFINGGRDSEGFIYISFGTVFEFSSESRKKERNEFVKALKAFPQYKFIWKSGTDIGTELPKNVFVTKWAPQQDLLAHPKIKCFITHGGLGGINEAMYYGVPMIAFPVFAEQDYNANFLEAKGIGIKLEILDLKSERLENAIKTVTAPDQRYKKASLLYSKAFKDRPMTPLQTAVWWTEYVLRYEANELTSFLRPGNVNQPFWVKRQLDVWLVFGFLPLLAVFYILFILLRSAINIILCRKPDSSVKRKHKIKRN